MIEEYAASLYMLEQLPYIRECDLQFVSSDQLFLDILLMKIRSKTILYATMKKLRNEEKEKELHNSIQHLESESSLT